jgi:predicted PurR-regulated permease PerM
MVNQRVVQNRPFFYGLFAAIALLALLLIFSFLGTIAFSLVMVIILKPVYDFFFRRVKKAGIATLLTIVVFFAVAIIPAWLLFNVATNQLAIITEDITSEQQFFEELATDINSLAAVLPFSGSLYLKVQQHQLQQMAQDMTRWLAGVMVGLGMAIPSLIARTFIVLGVLGTLLPNYHRAVGRMKKLSPLPDEVNTMYLRKIKSMVWAMFISIFVIAVAQGLVTGLFFVFGDIPYASLWTVLAIVASMLPLGASIIAIPVAIISILTGNTTGGLIVLIGYLLVVSNVDTVLRPKLVSKEAYLNFVLVLLAALGGYVWFGFFGVVYGPVLMVLLTTTIDVYETYYLRPNEAAV